MSERDPFVENLFVTAELAQSDLRRAEAFEAAAARIRIQAPRQIDNVINSASAHLIALAAEGVTDGRRLLEGVLDVNQHKPSNVVWSGPPDKEAALQAFDSLTPYALLLFVKDYHSDYYLPAVVSDYPVSVGVKIAHAMGGLPQADITFNAKLLERGEDDRARMAEEDTLVTLPHDLLLKGHVGRTAIQKLIDKQRVETYGAPCGHDRNNIAYMHNLERAVTKLMEASGVGLDLTVLTEILRKDKDQKEYELSRRRDEKPRRSRTRYR